MARFCNQGKANMFNIYLKNQAQNSHLYLGLFTAPAYEPAVTAILADLTEPVGGGYARIILEPEDWTITTGLATQLQKTFLADGAAWGNVYGYFITDVASGTSGNLIFAEAFTDGPYNCPASDTVKVTPKITAA